MNNSCLQIIVIFMFVVINSVSLLAEINPPKEEIIKNQQEQDREQSAKKLHFHGMFYMMRWIDGKHNSDAIYDDSYIGLSYAIVQYAGITLDIELNDVLYPERKWAATEIFGYINLLGKANMENISLLLKLGKLNKKNSYFGEYAMGIGKDFIDYNRINLDELNWQLAFIINKDLFPFEWNITSDLDFAQQISKNKNCFIDGNDKGFTVSNEMIIRELELNTITKYSLSIFYSEQFFVNEQKDMYDNSNNDYLDIDNRTTYMGASSKLLWQTDPIGFSIGGALKHFSIRKTISEGQQNIDSEIGFWLGNYSIIDFKAAFQQLNENKKHTEDTLGLETNFYMIPKLTLFAGLAIALEGNMENFWGVPMHTTKSRYGWDFGGIYTPISNVILVTGWQKMVRFDDLGYFYIKTTFWW